MFLSEAPTSRYKKFFKQFLLYCVSICINSKSVSQIFEIKFETGDINIFVLFGVTSAIHFQTKSTFSSGKKHPRLSLRQTFVENLSKFNVVKY